MELSRTDLDLLNSERGLRVLLTQSTPDIPAALDHVRYYRDLRVLQSQLIRLQTAVIDQGLRVVLLFEGRDAAGKGGAIKRFIQYLNPRQYRVVALRKPTPEEDGQWYFQRYIEHLPQAGEMVFFDRSWYNRAVLEPVNKLCTPQEYQRFMDQVNGFEQMLIESGIILFKFYFSIDKDEQARRLKALQSDPLKQWKYGRLDEYAQLLWEDYTRYKERMFAETDTADCPWVVIDANQKRDARLAAIRHVLDTVPHRADVELDADAMDLG